MLDLERKKSLPEPMQNLVEEHELFSKVLDAFERWSEALLLESKEDRVTLRRFLRFFLEFADGAHHVKEEKVLFEAMVRHGFSETEGPLALMLTEHNLARSLLADMTRIAGQGEPWSSEVCGDVNDLSSQFVTLLRNHIDKEDNILYPMAQARLPKVVWMEIAEGFANIDEENECSGMWDENMALAKTLLLN